MCREKGNHDVARSDIQMITPSIGQIKHEKQQQKKGNL